MRWKKIDFSGNDVRQQKFRRKTTTTAPRLLLVFAVLVLFCAAGAGTAAADTVNAGTFAELRDAITNATGGNSTRTIVIIDDIDVSTTAFPAIGTGQSITLTPAADRDYRIYRTAAIVSATTGLFTIGSDGNLTITDSAADTTLILDGNTSAVTGNTQPLVYVGTDGTFTLVGGTITDNVAEYGGGVYVSTDGTFTMSDGMIANNTVANYVGGGVENCGTFTMEGGMITNNTAMFGGGVDNDYGQFTLVGGEISGNTGYVGGGGVCVNPGSTFTLVGGEISGNTAEYGGGVDSYGSFTLVGGMITNNTADHDGGGIYVNPGSTFTMSGSALVDATNEVYLYSGTFINVTLPLTGGAYNITHRDNVTGTIVVELPASTADMYQSNFILSSAMSPFVLEYNASGPAPVYELAVGSIPTVTPTTPTTPPTIPPASGDGGSTESSFRVLFETNGGSSVLPVTGLSYGDRITAPANPVKDGYTFGGWYTNEACTIAWTFADAVPGDITLYAKWISSGAAPTTTATVAATTTPAVITTTATTVTATATMTTTATESPAATEAPAPVFGVLAGLGAAGVLIRRFL